MGVRVFDVYLTKSSLSMLYAKTKSKRKILKPRGGKPFKAISIRKLSPTSSVPRSPRVTVRETRSVATARETKSVVARRSVVWPSSSSDDVKVIKS